MRIVSYNILDGGEGRADPLAEVIQAQRPDLVGLVEADHPAVVDRIAARLEMNAVTGVGSRHSAALLCRGTILETINHAPLMPGMAGCFLEAMVKIDEIEWVVGVVHLYPRAGLEDERRRMSELAMIFRAMKHHKNEGRPHLLLGDFNSSSPIQRIDPAKCKPSTQKSWEANGGMIPRTVVKMLLDAGYVDTLAAARGAAGGGMGSFTTQFPGQRVDYIFSFGIPPEQIKAAWIEQDRLAKYASDHFPVGLEL